MRCRQFALFALTVSLLLPTYRSAWSQEEEDESSEDTNNDSDTSTAGQEDDSYEDSYESLYDDSDSSESDEEEDGLSLGSESLMLTAGTMQVGGQISFQVDAVKDLGGGGTVNFAPSAGYFIIDHVEILAEIGITRGFGDANPGDPMSFYFGAGAKYFIPVGILNLYAGGLIGMNFYSYEITGEREKLNSLLITLPVGLLFPLNRHIGLDVGARFNFNIGFGDNDIFQMTIPIGYFGIQGFFNLGG